MRPFSTYHPPTQADVAEKRHISYVFIESLSVDLRNPSQLDAKNAPAESILCRGVLITLECQLRLVAIFKVERPPAVVPFQRHFPPAKWDLRIRVERADIRPGLS